MLILMLNNYVKKHIPLHQHCLLLKHKTTSLLPDDCVQRPELRRAFGAVRGREPIAAHPSTGNCSITDRCKGLQSRCMDSINTH